MADAANATGAEAGVAAANAGSAAASFLSSVSEGLSDLDADSKLNALLALAAATLISYVHRRRSSFPELPKAWRSTESRPGGVCDSSLRSFVKTLITSLLLSVLPMQIAVVGSSIVLQTALYYTGFGGGRPGTPAFPAVPVDSPAWNPLAKAFFRFRDVSARAAAGVLLNDERNAPFLPWMAYLTLVTPAMFFVAAHHHVTYGQYQSFLYRLGVCFLYRIFMMGPYFKFFAHGATLIHKEGHANKMRRGLFKFKPLNGVMEWWVAFFYGHVPENYRVGHVEVHHGEGNDHGDVTSTLSVDRSAEGSFLMYLADFAEFWSNWTVVEWCDAKIAAGDAPPKVCADRSAALSGMVAYYGAAAALYLTVGPWFAFMYYLEPHCEIVNYLAAINYTWHTFADPDDHDNEYVKSITILGGHYAVFGEDYHVEHHLRPGVHWTKVAQEYEKRSESYRKNKATVFEDTMEFELFVMILLGDMDALASKFVDLSGEFPTHEDKKRELRRRMRAVPKPTDSAKEGWSSNSRASAD